MNPFYHLRPNKYVDRQLFLNILENLSSCYPISEYRYIGFGSYLFDDFKLLHNRLNIKAMISLEVDTTTYKRAEFNLPYKCIELKPQSSTDFISEYPLEDSNNIFWLDYTAPGEIGQQFSDLATLLGKANPYDIIKVTLNANASFLAPNDDSLNIHSKRLDKLRTLIGDSVPCDMVENDMSTIEYPKALLRCLQQLITTALQPSKYDKRYFFPLLPTIYKDGQTMLTLIGIILNDNSEETKVRNALKNIGYASLSWDNPAIINIPELSTQEILTINKLLPQKNALKKIMTKFPYIFDGGEKQAQSYISFYKFYPKFQNIDL